MRKKIQPGRPVWFILALWVIWVTGCAHSLPQAPGKTAWATEGSGVFHSETGPTFQGVGSAADMHSSSLLRASADNHAKAQLAALLEQYLTALAQYADIDTHQPDGRQIVHGIERRALDQAEISEHWYDEAKNTLYARCRIDLDTVKQIIASSVPVDMGQSNMLSEADQVFEAFVPSP